ncbi:MAG TPA: quinate 5-dehydrogenase [Chthonomonadaceae bacterium]|nr:quinate 5-dehydrogenase [Chthonomonadaceae bacterium]
MKRVVSISLGSSRRDKRVTAEFFGEQFEIERVGADGDMDRFRKMVAELDGKVDAFGVGGTDIYVYAGGRRYVLNEIVQLMSGAKQTPYVDGSGLKNTLEREAVAWLQDTGVVDFGAKRVLMVCAVDRFGMAEALATRAKSMVFGDLMFSLGIPIAMRSWESTQRLARILLPIAVRLPFKWIYPTGDKQEVNTPKYTPYFEAADVIAGDFHFIKRYMPADLAGKIILTNTTTDEDADALRQRGVRMLITTTPVFEGRSFGTNVMEAVLVTLLGRRPEMLTPEDYLAKFRELNWTPAVRELNPAPA